MRKIGLDLGSKTCGIAISDEQNKFALGLRNFNYTNNDMMLIINHLKHIIIEYNHEIDQFIVGYPQNLQNDNSNQSCERVDKFKMLLQTAFPSIEIIYIDENFSTVKANTMLFDSQIKASQRKKVIDMVSAIVILQDFLNTHQQN